MAPLTCESDYNNESSLKAVLDLLDIWTESSKNCRNNLCRRLAFVSELRNLYQTLSIKALTMTERIAQYLDCASLGSFEVGG